MHDVFGFANLLFALINGYVILFLLLECIIDVDEAKRVIRPNVRPARYELLMN